jgi:hypothetical protein
MDNCVNWSRRQPDGLKTSPNPRSNKTSTEREEQVEPEWVWKGTRQGSRRQQISLTVGVRGTCRAEARGESEREADQSRGAHKILMSHRAGKRNNQEYGENAAVAVAICGYDSDDV